MKILTTPDQAGDHGRLIEIPETLKRTYSVPWATPQCRQYNFGITLHYEFIHKHYQVNIYYCESKEKAILYPYFDKPAIALLVLVKGAVKSLHTEGFCPELSAGRFSLIYIPAGAHRVQLNTEITEACLVIFEKDYLAELTEGWPMQQQLLDMINNSSKTGVPFPSAILNYEVKSEIARMHTSHKTGYLLILELKSCITKLLGYYLTGIAEKNQLAGLPDIPYKDALIEIWETIKANPNIHDHTLNKLAGMHNLHVKTLGRKFIAMFDNSLSAFVREQCMQKAYMLVTTTAIPLEDIAFELGYSELTNFNRAFKLRFKMSAQSLRSSR